MQPLPAAACGCMQHAGTRRGTERETGDLQVTSKIEIMRKSQHPWGLPFGYRLRQFTQGVPKRSKHCLPNGCETLLRPSNTSWQQHLHRYWFPFLLYLEKHGSHGRRRRCNKVRLALFITALLKCKRKTRRELEIGPNLENKMPTAKINSKHRHDTHSQYFQLQ